MDLREIILTFFPETLLIVMLVVLLLLKIFSENLSRNVVLFITSFFLLAATVLTFWLQPQGSLFGGMFITTPLISIEKVLLLLATFVISLQAYGWLRIFRNYLEFYLLLIS